VEELLVERGVEVDHVTVFRWVQRFTPLLADAARFCRHSPGDRWFVDETYVKVNGVWRYVYRAVDQYGQVIDVLVSARRDADAARRFFQRALATLKVTPTEVVTDAAAVYPAVLDELIPSAWHHVERYANNRIEADHSQLKHRLRPMRGLRTDRTAGVVIAGHAFIQKPSTRPLRTGPRRTASLAGRHSVYRTRPGDLTGEPDHATPHPSDAIMQRRPARCSPSTINTLTSKADSLRDSNSASAVRVEATNRHETADLLTLLAAATT